MPTPPIAVPAGQSVIWVPATNVVTTQGFGCSAVATTTTGINTQDFANPLSNSFSDIVWSGYTVPNILTRPGTIVRNIIPTLIGNGHNALTVFILHLGGVAQAGYPWNSNGASPADFSDQWHQTGFGTNLSVLSTMTIATHTTQSTSTGTYPTPDFLNTTYAGVAVYIDTPPVPTVFIGVGNDRHVNVGVN